MLHSASKVVFLMITFTACVGFGLGRLDSKDFMVLAVAAFSYYFSIKTPGTGDDNKDKPNA